MYKVFVCASLLLAGVLAVPVKDALMFEGPDDTATVESTVREARAAPNHIGDLIKPGVKDAFLYVYGDAEDDDGDVHGYAKKSDDKGQDGYKHRDSFHKQDGNKYGYEKHSEYGQENKARIEVENDKGIKKAHQEANGEDDDGEETRKSYSVLEDSDHKKQAKKKVEPEFNYFGEDGDSANYYGDDKKEKKEEAEDGDGESSEEYEESEEGDEAEGDEEDDY